MVIRLVQIQVIANLLPPLLVIIFHATNYLRVRLGDVPSLPYIGSNIIKFNTVHKSPLIPKHSRAVLSRVSVSTFARVSILNDSHPLRWWFRIFLQCVRKGHAIERQPVVNASSRTGQLRSAAHLCSESDHERLSLRRLRHLANVQRMAHGVRRRRATFFSRAFLH